MKCPNCEEKLFEGRFHIKNEDSGKLEHKMGFLCRNCGKTFLSPEWRVKSGELIKP